MLGANAVKHFTNVIKAVVGSKCNSPLSGLILAGKAGASLSGAIIPSYIDSGHNSRNLFMFVTYEFWHYVIVPNVTIPNVTFPNVTFPNVTIPKICNNPEHT